MSRSRDVVEVVAKALADHPDAVRVTERQHRGQTLVELFMAPGDLGRVIGRQGRTAAALRTLVAATSELDGSKAKTSPFDAAVPDAKKVIWVKPTLVGEVEFRSWTSDRASAAAFIDGAAIARSKKPIEVRQTLSFFAIYTDPYGLHGIAVPARMVLHFVAPRGGVIELRGCSGLQQAASTDKAANLDVTRRPTASSVRRPLPERCPASSLTLRGIASCDDRVRVLHWCGRG